MKYPNIEAIKEILRYAIFVAISALITAIVDQLTKLPDQTIIIMAITAILRGIDKWLHERGKLTKVHKSGQAMGLLPF